MAGERQENRWVIGPSLWFDAVCLIPLLAELPFYTSRHEQDARWWQKRFASIAGQQARDGVSVLRDEIAHRAARPFPAFLALWTCAGAGPPGGAAECLDGLIAAVADPKLLVSAMRETSPRWNEGDDRLFRSIRPALLAVLEGLRAAGLADWWAGHAADDLHRRCEELYQPIAGYDLVPLVEQHTRVCFDARTVELCVLRYDAGRVHNIAVRELRHPPWPKGHSVKGRLDALGADPFLAARFAGRDLAADYNTWASYAEEDAAQALDQFLNTQLGRNTRGDPATRWTAADGGMHVLDGDPPLLGPREAVYPRVLQLARGARSMTSCSAGTRRTPGRCHLAVRHRPSDPHYVVIFRLACGRSPAANGPGSSDPSAAGGCRSRRRACSSSSAMPSSSPSAGP